MKKTTIIAILFALLPTPVLAADPAVCSIIPIPQKVEARAGTFKLTKDSQILTDAASREAGKLLADRLMTSTGYPLQLAEALNKKPPGGSIVLTVDESIQGGTAEAYDLTADADSVVIRGSDAAGVFYGTQSLLQLFPPEVFASKPRTNIKWAVPCQRIEDRPRFKWRGMLLDVSRHFFSTDEVKRVLDLMALHKLNTFQWHLVDDEGWRLEIKNYPRLTSQGAWRAGIGFYQDPRWSKAYGPDGQYGGFYTQDEIRDIVAYAQARHITIVPEIEMPGHSGAALRVHPELLCINADGTPTTAPAGPNRFRTALCAGNDQSIAFEQDVLTEVFSLFPGKYIHIGGDEVDQSAWRKCPRCQARMKAEGLKNERELQSCFLRRMEKFINEHGRTLVGWSEIRLGGITPSAVLMDWKGGATASASEGHDVVMTPSVFCYFDFNQSLDPTIEPRAIGNYIPLHRVYSFEPVPKDLDPQFAGHILGSQGNLWTELISSQRHLDFMTYPRLCALSEVVWSPRELRNWDDFQKRLTTHYRRLDQLGVNYFQDTSAKVGEWKSAQIKSSEPTTLEWDVTNSMRERGKYHVLFDPRAGAAGINIAWVALLEDGKEIARDTHQGYAGAGRGPVAFNDSLYILGAPGRKAGAKYTLRASVTAQGGADCAGEVRFDGPMRQPLW